jgi:predicted phage tail protein
MTEYDSDHQSLTDSEVGEAAGGAERIVQRNVVPIQIAVFYAVVLGAGLLARRLVHGPNIDTLISIGIWFTVIFAGCTAILGGTIKLVSAVQRRRHDYE